MVNPQNVKHLTLEVANRPMLRPPLTHTHTPYPHTYRPEDWESLWWGLRGLVVELSPKGMNVFPSTAGRCCCFRDLVGKDLLPSELRWNRLGELLGELSSAATSDTVTPAMSEERTWRVQVWFWHWKQEVY